MKHALVTLAAIMALIAARGLYAADEHKGHEHMHEHASDVKDAKAHEIYKCPMHKDVTSDKPGKCPKCNMNLEMDKDHGGTKSR